MVLRTINIVLLISVMIAAFCLISRRYQTRTDSATLSSLELNADKLDKEYSRLQIEEGTFSSNLVLQEFAINKLGLVQPDKQHIVGIK